MCLPARYISNIMLDGLRADHQSSQPGTPSGSGINVAGFGDSCVCPLCCCLPCTFALRCVRWAGLLSGSNCATKTTPGDRPHIGAHNFGMMNPGPIWKQTQQFGDNGAIVHRLIVWRSNDAVANVRSPPYDAFPINRSK